ncbi:MAG: helix-turn-helix domain-containing protein [Sphingomonas sp.]|uniref:helix-turn-helix domain-containing protein n=1 Tax=Sphingomonas sp. TaxID=28214 RepID=UPI0025E8A9C5|nr:helix-turn-helix domain-containing protein [Sphingomonas sp.]MBX3566353.1 helix-turn-helix domain-containing protein [Sphingomonas sp.]
MVDFTTATMHPDEGREAWLDQLAALCGRRAAMQFAPEPFSGSIQHREVGGISICRFSHNVRQIEQNKQPQNDDRSRYLMMIMQLKGRSMITQSANDIALAAGEIAIIDSFRPFVTRFDGSITQMIAYLPAAELAIGPASSGLARPYRMSGREGIGALARSTLLAIAKSADQLADDDADHARQMLTGVVRRLIDRNRRSVVSIEQALPDRRIRAFIEARLADPELCPIQIASGCGVSLRRLHRSFSDTEWSVCSWIRHRRLEQCRKDLLDPSQDRLTITQIAFRWGFNDAAHFSRSFRDAYGTAPRDLRQHAA